MIKRKSISGGKKVLYFILIVVLSLLGSSGYYMDKVRPDFDPEKKSHKKIFLWTILCFIGAIVMPFIAMMVL